MELPTEASNGEKNVENCSCWRNESMSRWGGNENAIVSKRIRGFRRWRQQLVSFTRRITELGFRRSASIAADGNWISSFTRKETQDNLGSPVNHGVSFCGIRNAKYKVSVFSRFPKNIINVCCKSIYYYAHTETLLTKKPYCKISQENEPANERPNGALDTCKKPAFNHKDCSLLQCRNCFPIQITSNLYDVFRFYFNSCCM